MIRVLHSVSNMDRAGIETMLMNYYRHIDRSKLQFDFLQNKPKPGNYDDEIRELGGNIYISPGLNPIKYPAYLKFVEEILKNNSDIKILHAHNEAMGLYALNGAKRGGIKTRIAHAHNTKIIKDYKYPLKIFCKRFLTSFATELWSCGRDAGIYFFGDDNWNKKGMVMRNAVETEEFKFSEESRRRIREEFGIGNKTVIGHVGRFNVQKNHIRLIEIFAEYLKINSSALLVLIGEGELEEDVKIKAKELNIYDHILFAGLRENVNRWYSAMDVFVMPSLFEGLPVVGIEAQCAGLPCVFSDSITDEVVVSKSAVRLSLDGRNSEWAKKIFEFVSTKRDRTDGPAQIKASGYDIETEAKRIEKIYLSMSER